jgi:hypothetical protein
MKLAAVATLSLLTLSGCASTSGWDRYAAQCERERQEQRALAASAGAVLGAAAGAAVAENDTRGAAIGGAAGALLGSHLGGGYSQVCRDYFARYPESRGGYRY